MKDRNVQYPQRYQLVKVDGTDNIYDLTPAPGTIADEGTLINKSTLLKDATAALFNLDTDAVPDDVLSILSKAAILVDGNLELPNGSPVPQLKIETGTYVGTGTYGESNPTVLTFSRPPVFLIISNTNQVSDYVFGYGLTGAFWNINTNGPTFVSGKISNNGKTISLYSTKADWYQCNASGNTYSYSALITA